MWSQFNTPNRSIRSGRALERIALSSFFHGALRLHVRAVELIPPPTNPPILMLVHIRLGHIKPVINDVLIGLFFEHGAKVLS